jgi:CheY-like chemotaxis protein
MRVASHFISSMPIVLAFASGARRAYLAKKLRQLGCVVITATNPTDAPCLRGGAIAFDVIVVDVEDPEDGCKMLELVRQTYPVAIPGFVIATTPPSRRLRRLLRAAQVHFLARRQGLTAVRHGIERLTRARSGRPDLT